MNRELSLGTESPPDLVTMAHQLQTREDFISFVHALLVDLKHSPGEWENATLGDYLEAMEAWTRDMDGYFRNRGEVTPPDLTWQLLGRMLLAARVYE